MTLLKPLSRDRAFPSPVSQGGAEEGTVDQGIPGELGSGPPAGRCLPHSGLLSLR